ncbi:sugar kinase [Aliishimia ponticola]|uniref:Sugar kinase n=1 Tax=Aliishimia ponticola TaxID=2499833 RepID=A0A4S4ND13_9RHOB|nr:sugar kinase [Aliishimia ponticola]THH35921.1 sugar kinase [Aliishimia ponticola]
MTRVACLGEAMVELSMSGENNATVGVAGDTLNTAIYLKRAAPEIEVDYITRLGTCPFSERIRGFIASEDIGTARITSDPSRTPGLYAITVDDTGERTFTYWRSAAAARDMFADHDFAALDGYDLIYLSGISLAILPGPVRMALLDYLRGSGARLAFDGNYRPRLWEDADTARRVSTAYGEAAHILLPSIDDEMALYEETAAQVQDRLMALGAGGALKRSSAGPLSLSGPVTQDYPAARKVVDTTAAGDSFNGGYLAALLSGADQAAALMAGHRLAAEVVQHRGAIIPASATRALYEGAVDAS